MTQLHVRKTQKFGWIPDLPDKRDLIFDQNRHKPKPKPKPKPPKPGPPPPPVPTPGPAPGSIDLRPQCPPVYDQGQLGSCTANAIAGCVEFDLKRQGLTDFVPGRLFIYYQERVIEGTVRTDSGAMLRDGAKVVNQLGVPNEKNYPYDIKKFALPPLAAEIAEAAKTTAAQYLRIPDGQPVQIKQALNAGFPVAFGFTVYTSFESPAVAKTGLVPMPHPSESVLGGHAVVIVGYDDAKQHFIVRNSWGASWGDRGYCYMPYGYVGDPNLASDFWVIQAVT